MSVSRLVGALALAGVVVLGMSSFAEAGRGGGRGGHGGRGSHGRGYRHGHGQRHGYGQRYGRGQRYYGYYRGYPRYRQWSGYGPGYGDNYGAEPDYDNNDQGYAEPEPVYQNPCSTYCEKPYTADYEVEAKPYKSEYFEKKPYKAEYSAPKKSSKSEYKLKKMPYDGEYKVETKPYAYDLETEKKPVKSQYDEGVFSDEDGADSDLPSVSSSFQGKKVQSKRVTRRNNSGRRR